MSPYFTHFFLFVKEKTKSRSVSALENTKSHRKNTDFSGKPLDKLHRVKYINHRMLALLDDEC